MPTGKTAIDLLREVSAKQGRDLQRCEPRTALGHLTWEYLLKKYGSKLRVFEAYWRGIDPSVERFIEESTKPEILIGYKPVIVEPVAKKVCKCGAEACKSPVYD